MIGLENFLRRLRGKEFRAFVHAPDRSESGVGGCWAGHAAPSTRRLWTQLGGASQLKVATAAPLAWP
jgi:hypothetical protein